MEFSRSQVTNLERQVQNNGTNSEMEDPRSNFHRVFCSPSDSLKYESAGENDYSEPLSAVISHEEDDFVLFIGRTISDPFCEF